MLGISVTYGGIYHDRQYLSKVKEKHTLLRTTRLDAAAKDDFTTLILLH